MNEDEEEDEGGDNELTHLQICFEFDVVVVVVDVDDVHFEKFSFWTTTIENHFPPLKKFLTPVMFVSVTLSTYLYTYLVSRSLKLEEAPTTGTQTVARINNFILANFKLWLLLLLFCCCCTKTTLNPSKKFDCVRKHLWALQIHLSLSHTHSSLSLSLFHSQSPFSLGFISKLLHILFHSLSLSLSCYPSLRLRAPACYNVVVICVHSRLGFMLNAFDDDGRPMYKSSSSSS